MKKIFACASILFLVIALVGCSSPSKEPEAIIGAWSGDGTIGFSLHDVSIEANEDGTIEMHTMPKSGNNHAANSTKIGMGFEGTWKRIDKIPGIENDKTNASARYYEVEFNGVKYYVAAGEISGEKQLILYALNEENKFDMSKISVTAKPMVADGELSAEEIDAEINAQPVRVINTEYLVQDANYKNLYPDFLMASVLNESGSNIRNLTLGYVAWDENGLPVSITPKGSSTSYYYVETGMSDANILDGTTWKDKGLALSGNQPSNISQFKVIVSRYTDFDGNSWENPLLEAWQDIYENKPLAD